MRLAVSPGGTSPPVWMCIYWQRVVFNNMVLYGYTCVQNTVIYVQSRLWLHGYPPVELNHCKMIWTFNFYLITATFRSPVLSHSSQDSIQIRKTGCILSAAGLNSKSFPATTLKLNHEAKLPKDVLQALRSGLRADRPQLSSKLSLSPLHTSLSSLSCWSFSSINHSLESLESIKITPPRSDKHNTEVITFSLLKNSCWVLPLFCGHQHGAGVKTFKAAVTQRL